MRALIAVGLMSAISLAHADELAWKPPRVSGPADPAAVDRMLRRSRARLTHCYRQARTRAPRLRGTLTATFTVQPTGAVTAVRVEGLDNDLENCAAATVRALRFAAIAAASRVKVAFTLKPPPPPPPPPRRSPLDALLGPACVCPCASSGLGAC